MTLTPFYCDPIDCVAGARVVLECVGKIYSPARRSCRNFHYVSVF